MQLTLFYVIWPPLFFINCSTRFGIDSISFRQSWAIFSLRNHMPIIASMSLVRVVQSFLSSLVFTILHKFSIGFKSGEFPGQSRTLIPFSSKIFFTFLQNNKKPNLDHKRSHHPKCKTSPKENVLGLFQLPGCWTTLSCYRDDECGKMQWVGETKSV